MRTIRWAPIRPIAVVVILSFQSMALAGIALSLLLIGSLAGGIMDSFFSDGGHRITITLFVLGSLALLACAAAATSAIAIGANLGYRGTRRAMFWRTMVGVGPGVGNRIGWFVMLAVGAVAAVWCAMLWRDRAQPASPTIPPAPPLPAG
jgi:hypothetical protein